MREAIDTMTREIAAGLMDAGAKVWFSGPDLDALEELAGSLAEEGFEVSGIFRYKQGTRAAADALNAPYLGRVIGGDDNPLRPPVAQFPDFLLGGAQPVDLDLHLRMQGGVSKDAAGHLARRLLRREEIGKDADGGHC